MDFKEKDLIEKYLYGELSDSAQEDLEERFFLDAEFYERIETVEMNLVDRYVRKEMSADEKLRFEQSYLTNSERREKVSEVILFHNQLAQLETEPIALKELEKSPTQSWSEWFSKIFNFQMPAFQLASAAVAVLVVAGVFWVVLHDNSTEIAGGNYNIEPPPINTQIPRDTNINNSLKNSVKAKLVPKLHHGNIENIDTEKIETVAINIAEKTNIISLEFPVPNEIKGESYSIIIKDQNGKEILTRKYSRQPEETSEGRFISISVPTKDFINSKYTVLINSDDNTKNTSVYQFIIKRNV